jgi:hypothetical protein
MAKMAWLLVFSLVSILLFSGCLTVNTQGTSTSSKCNDTKCETCPPPVVCNETKCDACPAPVTCNATKIVQTTTTIASGSISDEIAKCDLSGGVECYNSVALAYEDPSLCRGETIYGVYLSELKDECITAVAIKYNKQGYCNLIGTPSIHECFDSFN